MNPVRPDMKQPSEEGQRAEDARLRVEPEGDRAVGRLTTLVDVTNTMTASGTRMTRWCGTGASGTPARPPGSPSAISFIFGVPWVGGEHAAHQVDTDHDGRRIAVTTEKNEPEPLGPAERELW